MWEVIFSLPETLENVLKELFIQLQDPQNTFFCTYSDQTSLLSLAVSYQKKPWCPLSSADAGNQELHAVGSLSGSDGR